MSSRSAALNANSPPPDTKIIVAETKRVVELWKKLDSTRMSSPLKELYRGMMQQMEKSLQESSKVANKGEDWMEHGLQAWKEGRKETFQKNYVEKGRGEADSVIAALRNARKAADQLVEQLRPYPKPGNEKGGSGRSTTMTSKSPEIMQEIIDYGRERMNLSSLICLWFYVRDEIFFCIETNLEHMSPAIDFLGEQVEDRWTTLGQIYVNYAIEFRISGLDHDTELARKKLSSLGKICSLSRFQ